MKIKPWMWVCGGCLCLIVILGIIKWRKCCSTKEKVSTVTKVCRYNDLARQERGPTISAESLHPLVTQPLFCLGKGLQSVVYETADGQYVLKLFKKAGKKHKDILKNATFGALIARNDIPTETGVIACSLGPNDAKLPVITIVNRKGKISKVELQDIPFVFQFKPQPFKKTILTLVIGKKLKEATARIESVFTMLTACREKGVMNGDKCLFKSGHIGFVGTRAIMTETGKLSRMVNKTKLTFAVLKQLKPMLAWLEKTCPDLVPAYKAAEERYKTSG